MKNYFFCVGKKKGEPKKKFPVIRTFGELAKEVGLTNNQLRGHFSCSSIPTPKPSFNTQSTLNNEGANRTIQYYSRKEFMTWWKEHLKIINHMEDGPPEET